MKRQLAPSPFASPVLKHPCTVRDDEVTPPVPTFEESPATPCTSSIGVSSLTEVTEESRQAQPLCLADLQSSELTGITSTTCTSYFNKMCLEDSEREITGISSINGHRLHPLHSTAHLAHLGLTRLANWHETPVPFTDRDGNSTRPQISGVSRIHSSVSGTVSNQYSSGLDSGVGRSAEVNNQGIEEEVGQDARSNPGRVSPPPHKSDSQASEMNAHRFLVPALTAPGVDCSCTSVGSGSWSTTSNEGNKHGTILSTIHEGIPTTQAGQISVYSPDIGCSPSVGSSNLLNATQACRWARK